LQIDDFQEQQVRVVIAGGGTGGHLFPGIAVAEEFLSRDKQTEVLFVGTKRGIENKLLNRIGYELRTIDIEGVKGRGLKALVKGLYQIPQSMWQSRRILKEFLPQIVIGVGGYASGPAVLTAHFMGIPTAIAEQNIIPGITNRILGKIADKIFVTYAETANRFSRSRVVLSGNPVRAAMAGVQSVSRTEKNFRQLLIFGGSQGAMAINRSVVEMLPQIKKMKTEIHMLHQTGAGDLESVREAYNSYGINAEVSPFIVDMAGAYERADLIICRAGATSLAEITAAGKVPILIPFPFAANDHQTKNARALADAGAAVMINESELSGEKLFKAVEELLGDEKKLRRMEEKSTALGNIHAAATIVDNCLKLITRN
jgi:UDP-N-acetylglucosamine--N-acetylmuramyl-(pentapeptide) pyrophosphoryl-undecaprenol N-acetylglucosamine transferase